MFIVYSKENCSQCDQAEMLLTLKGVTYNLKKLGVDFSKEDLLSISPKSRSFPIVLCENKVIGGLVELRECLKLK